MFEPAAQQQGLLAAVTGQEAAPETLKILGFDTGMTKSGMQDAASALTPKMQPLQAPQLQRGQGYVKQYDSLARALEAFKSTQANRRA